MIAKADPFRRTLYSDRIGYVASRGHQLGNNSQKTTPIAVYAPIKVFPLSESMAQHDTPYFAPIEQRCPIALATQSLRGEILDRDPFNLLLDP